ncbi:unnamed protein product [Symbiodinium pilosum]|uniref:U3 small nucleolar RNA-associated protein 11 n=1 Tax=Symbiodinium pilosum TaxID=2952 RepID=A0A812UBY6_SYMPI|nr:unnamed protein product [Symbiodinium pilosum]
MGADGGLRHVVHKRVHLERHQPKHRRKLGYLEKHKDYVKRAKDFHKKEDIIKDLHRKAYFKNEDEFAYGMMSHSTTKDGKKQKKKVHLSQEEQQLAESQDTQYVAMREQIDNKAVEKRTQRLHFLDADKPNKHVVFVDEDELRDGGNSGSSSSQHSKRSLKGFNVAEYFDTHPALLTRKANRLRLKQLETKTLQQPEPMAAATTRLVDDGNDNQDGDSRISAMGGTGTAAAPAATTNMTITLIVLTCISYSDTWETVLQTFMQGHSAEDVEIYDRFDRAIPILQTSYAPDVGHFPLKVCAKDGSSKAGSAETVPKVRTSPSGRTADVEDPPSAHHSTSALAVMAEPSWRVRFAPSVEEHRNTEKPARIQIPFTWAVTAVISCSVFLSCAAMFLPYLSQGECVHQSVPHESGRKNGKEVL